MVYSAFCHLSMVAMDETPLRILFALQYYVPHRTGLTLYVQRLAEALAARGHQVTVLTARYRDDLPREEQLINGVRVIRLWAPIRVSRGMVMPAYPLAAARLVASHDVVSIHTPMLETAIFAALTKIYRKGLLITHHGDLILPAGLQNRFIMWFTFQMFRLAGEAADRIIAYSNDYADHSYYVAPFRNKTLAIYPPISVAYPDPDASQAMRNQWLRGAGDLARVIGYAGRFVEEKRPDILIKALSTIHAQRPGTKIVFAGQYDISYESFFSRHADLIECFKDSLIFLGLLTDNQAIANFYAACDVLALSSDTECFALVQVEAMRCGTPVVATDIPGAREVIRVTGMGELVKPGDPVAFGEGVLRVLNDRAAYVKTLAHIDSVFSFSQTVADYERQLRAVAAHASRSHK